jgi:flagellar biogenesis protein FliO
MHIRTVTLIALMAAALTAQSSVAQTSRPSAAAVGTSVTTPVRPGTVASEPIKRHRKTDVPMTTRPAGVAKVAAPGFDTTRVVLSLAIVLGLIFVLRWGAQRLFGKTVASRASRAVQVISRNVISPKQQLLVVQVGRRLVVVGDSGQQMNALCEITDPDEITALVGQLHEEKRELTGNPFGALFGRAGSQFTKDDEPKRPVGAADDGDDEMTDGSTASSSVQDTRDQLNGLMDKVRVMSRQFRRT